MRKKTQTQTIPNMSPNSEYCSPSSLGRLSASRRTRMERENFIIYEDETATSPVMHSPINPQPNPQNQNAQSNLNAESIPGPHTVEHPNPDQETPDAEIIYETQAEIENHIDNNVPVTPSTSAAIGLEQMILASRRQLFVSESENFSIGLDDIAEELDEPTSPTPANRSALPNIPSADGISAGGPWAETFFSRIPTRSLSPPMVHTPTRLMPSPQTPVSRPSRTRPPQTPVSRPSQTRPPQTPASRASRSRTTQSPAARLLRSTGPSQRLIVRSTGIQDNDGVNARPGVVRNLFTRQGTNLVSTPSPNRNASEPRVFRLRTGHDPLHPSRLRSVSFTSSRNEDTEIASPSVAIPEFPTGETHVTTPQGQTEENPAITPESQTGGSPPTPHTPVEPSAWILPSQATPDLVARMFVTPVYRNRDEPMEITPSPPELRPASPNDRDVEEAFWTPSKPTASLNVAAAQNPGPMEHEAIFDDAMAQEFAPIQSVAAIGNPAPVQDAMSPGTKTMRTFISTEITTTITTTPSPQLSPIPAHSHTDNLRRTAATPHRTANAPRRPVASTPQQKKKGGAEQDTSRRRTADRVIAGGMNRRQELRDTPRYSLRDSTRGILPGTYLLTPVRDRPLEPETASKKK